MNQVIKTMKVFDFLVPEALRWSKKFWTLRINPANQKVQLKYHLERADAIAVLTDLWGRKIVEIPLLAEQEQVSIETAHLPQGVYILKVLQEGKILFTERLIIQ